MKKQIFSMRAIPLFLAGLITIAAGCVGTETSGTGGQTSGGRSADAALIAELEPLRMEDAADDGEKKEICKKQAAIIKKHLPRLDAKTRAAWEERLRKIEAEIRHLDGIVKFNSALAALERLLEDPKLSAGEKRGAIKRFFREYQEYETDRRGCFVRLNAKYISLEKFEAWEKIEAEVAECCKYHPESASDPEFEKYRKKCRQLLDSLSEFNEASLYPRKSEAKKRLTAQLEYFDSISRTASYKDVKNAEEKYRKDPSVENYNNLRAQISAFEKNDSPEAQGYRTNVNKILKDSENFHNAGKRFQEFLNDPQASTWMAFFNSVGVIDEKYPQKYKTIRDDVALFLQTRYSIKIQLRYWNFKGTKFDRDVADCHVYINRTGNGGVNIWEAPDGDLYCCDIPGGKWDASDESYRQDTKRRLLLPDLEAFKNKDILEIQFANLHGKNVFSAVHTISVYALLVKARENGSCEWGIEDNPGGGYLELKFEGLPKF